MRSVEEREKNFSSPLIHLPSADVQQEQIIKDFFRDVWQQDIVLLLFPAVSIPHQYSLPQGQGLGSHRSAKLQ